MKSIIPAIETQDILFQDDLNRVVLKKIKTSRNAKKIRIHVFRNHSFEAVASVLNTFLGYARMQAVLSYSDYDDSFSFSEVPKKAELLLLWIDVGRYNKPKAFKKRLTERLEYLREKTKVSILVVSTDGLFKKDELKIPGCYVTDLRSLEKKLGNSFFDERLTRITGTRLSNKACLEVARLLGLSLIPPLFLPNLKAIVLDLDNTLYQGVIGEDGIQGIRLTKEHTALQQGLKKLSKQGFFLALASKNELADVKKMFSVRKDFPLTWKDFSAYGISWGRKTATIARVAKKLRIAPESMLFVDDNMGEILSVVSAIPKLQVVHADVEHPLKTLRKVSLYPGVFKWYTTGDDAKRARDLEANEKREELVSALSPTEYLKQLKIEITYHVNGRENIQRIAELGGKTNQFILSYTRMGMPELQAFVQQKGHDIVDFSLKDNLSDSGLIGAILTRFDGKDLIIHDLFVSCRALGRNVEDIMILTAVNLLRRKYEPERVVVRYQRGERNQPALTWLQKVVSRKLGIRGDVVIEDRKFVFDAGSVKVLVSK